MQKKSLSSDIIIREVQSNTLLEEPDLLNAVISLLIDAHYQTTPDDLMALLDAPEQRLFVAFSHSTSADNLVAAVCGNIEGALNEAELTQHIVAGQRRVQGHMLAQQVAYASAEPQRLEHRYFRVIRIAVTAPYRRCGIGQKLLKHIVDWCIEQQIDFLGSSFGGSAALLKFWLAADFVPVQLGFHRDKATAEYNLSVLRPVAAGMSKHMPELQNNLKQLLLFHLVDLYQQLDNALMAMLLQSCTDTEGNATTQERALRLFAWGDRSLELSAPYLRALAIKAAANPNNDTEALALLSNYALKRLATEDLIKRHQFTGKKQLVAGLREAVKTLQSE